MKLAIAAIAALAATPAASQSLCGQRAQVVEKLADDYGETARAVGVSTQGGVVVEIWASDAGSWTIFATDPNGTACLIAAGEGFSMATIPPVGEPM